MIGTRSKVKRNVWLNTVAGLAGGAIASWVMNQFQAGLTKVSAPKQEQGEPATVRLAEKISVAATGRQLSKTQRERAEPLVHYAFGTLVGGLYGMAAAKARVATAGAGTVYGSAVWLLADEVGVPAAGLSAPPHEIPVQKHVEALASHLVYGLTLEGVRRLCLKLRVSAAG